MKYHSYYKCKQLDVSFVFVSIATIILLNLRDNLNLSQWSEKHEL